MACNPPRSVARSCSFNQIAASSTVGGVIADLPSLAQARLLRVTLRRADCAAYDLDAIRSDLEAAFLASPCCAACVMEEAETAAFVRERPR